MKYRFFAVPALGSDQEQEALNTFCASHRVVTLEKHFVAAGAESFWAICVTTQEGALPGRPALDGRRDRVDYRQVLGEEDFAVYVQLRALRKQLSERDGVPPYNVFTNDQLAEMVKRRVSSLPELAAIDGVGNARVEKYGANFVDRLNSALTASPSSSDAPPAD